MLEVMWMNNKQSTQKKKAGFDHFETNGADAGGDVERWYKERVLIKDLS